MIFYEEDESETDDGFGPGSDLVLSFLGVVLLLIGVFMVKGLPKIDQDPLPPPVIIVPTGAPDSRITDLEQNIKSWKLRASQAEQALSDKPALHSNIEKLEQAARKAEKDLSAKEADMAAWKKRAEKAEKALGDLGERKEKPQRREPPREKTPTLPVAPTTYCSTILQRAALGDPLTPADQKRMREECFNK